MLPDVTDTGPYPPSWIDRLIDRIEGLPGPSWVAHAVAAIAVGLVANAAGWVDGFLKLDQYDPLLTSLVPFLVGSLAAIHYLDWGRRASLDGLPTGHDGRHRAGGPLHQRHL
jgi:hypothetical protein